MTSRIDLDEHLVDLPEAHAGGHETVEELVASDDQEGRFLHEGP